MAEATADLTWPRLVSYAVRATAAIMLLQLVLLLVVELGLSDSLYDLYFSAEESGWSSELNFQVLNIANFVLLMVWCGLTNRAFQEVANPDLKHGPVMAALWFVVPFASFFKPYDVVKELYQVSRTPVDWDEGKARIVVWWWIIRIVGNLLGLALNFIMKDASAEVGGLLLTLQVLMSIELGFQLFLVTRMTRWQGQPVKKSVAEVF